MEILCKLEVKGRGESELKSKFYGGIIKKLSYMKLFNRKWIIGAFGKIGTLLCLKKLA